MEEEEDEAAVSSREQQLVEQWHELALQEDPDLESVKACKLSQAAKTWGFLATAGGLSGTSVTELTWLLQWTAAAWKFLTSPKIDGHWWCCHTEGKHYLP
jgi:hypothetical protein